MKRAGKYVLRVAAGVVLFLALGGPAPGNIGGCGSTTPVADPRQFCVDFEFWKCRRDEFAGRLSAEQAQDCYASVEGRCSGSNAWPAGCSPTPAQTQACINILMRQDLAGIATPELLTTHDECTLCM